MIGPGNVISANLIGVLISGATATDVIVIGNLIGTDSTGEADLGNAQAGVEIENATGAIVEGNSQGSQVISGNLVGVEINGRRRPRTWSRATSSAPTSRARPTGATRTKGPDRGGVRQHGRRHDRGGTQRDLGQPVGNPARRSDRDRQLIEGNDVGTDVTGTLPLGNEINGIIFSNNASNNTIGGTGGGQGNTIAFNVAAGVLVQSGTGDSILSNSIYLQRAAGDRPDRDGQRCSDCAGAYRGDRRRHGQQYRGVAHQRRRTPAS